jgi:hypothetical protein
MFPSRKKKHFPSDAVPANGPASQSHSQQLPFHTRSQSQSLQQKQQSQPVYPWSAQATPSGSSLLPSPQEAHTLSTTTTTTRELFLFGGFVHKTKSPSDVLYVISTRDFSATLLQTTGDIPSPRSAHAALLTGTTLLIWGGTDFSGLKTQEQSNDDSFYLLNLGTSDLFDLKSRSS